MNAKRTFVVAKNRALYLYLVNQVLKNQRKRAARSDWSGNFKEFMKWKKSESLERVDGKNAVLILREGCSLKAKHFKEPRTDDLLRASLVMIVSAMDAYYHTMIATYVAKAFRSKEPPTALLDCRITISDLEKAHKGTRLGAHVRSAIERHLSHQPLQSPKAISKGLSLIGIKDFWVSVSKEMGRDKDVVEKKLKRIAKRRHQIVHEGDLSQGDKTKNKDRRLSSDYVRDAIYFIDSLVNSSHEVITGSYKKSKAGAATGS